MNLEEKARELAEDIGVNCLYHTYSGTSYDETAAANHIEEVLRAVERESSAELSQLIADVRMEAKAGVLEEV